MPVSVEEKKARLRRRANVFLKTINAPSGDEAVESLVDLLDDFQIDLLDLRDYKADRSELREILIEMREGFRRVDERFEDINKRFSSLQWMIALGFSILAVMLTLFRFLGPLAGQ